jgi:site-specific DNA-cytosine methylase
MNVHSQANRGCVQMGAGSTGSTYKDIRDFIKRSSPKLFILENVAELSEKTDGMEFSSDEDFILKDFATIGYMTSTFRFNCATFGSRCDRDRLYFVGIEVPDGCHKDVSNKVFQFIGNVMDSMQVDPLEFDDFALSEEQRRC